MTTKAGKKDTQDAILIETEDLSRVGAALLRVKPRSKVAIEKGWSTAARITGDQFAATRKVTENIGVRLGEPSKTQFGFLHALDVDVKKGDAVSLARAALLDACPNADELPSVISGSGGASRHIYFFSPEPLESWTIAKGDGWEVALKGTGTYVVAPGSIHPDTGEPYRWERRMDIETWDLTDAPVVDLSRLKKPLNVFQTLASEPVELDRLQHALRSIDPTTLGYEEWRNVGMALHHEGSGCDEAFRIWNSWSESDSRQGGKGYPGKRKLEAHWLSFGKQRTGLPVTGATIIQMERQALNKALLEELANEVPDFCEASQEAQTSALFNAANEADALGEIELSEDGVSRAFAAKYEGKLLYCHTSKKWFAWTGTRWKREETRLVLDACRRMCHRVAKNSPNAKSALQKLGRYSNATGVEKYAQANRAFAVTAEHWDQNIWLLGTPGGTIDLRTGEMREARTDDAITKLTGAAPIALEQFESSQHCPRWMQFLDQATGGDSEVIRFLQQWAGYCLTGETREEALLFVHGPGSSGKSTFINTLATALGDYARSMEAETLTAQKHARHSTEVARLAGVRLAYASETEAGRTWAENRIKQLTGGDIVVARFMRQDDFEFKPQLKLSIVGNNRPTFEKLDTAIKRRFKVLAFDKVPAEPDKDLKSALEAELPGILSWAIAGCLDWLGNGLQLPNSMVRETEDYFASEDFFFSWLDDNCEQHPDYSSSSTELLENLNWYLRQQGRCQWNKNQFADEMKQRRFQKKRTNRGVVWCGLRVRKLDEPHYSFEYMPMESI